MSAIIRFAVVAVLLVNTLQIVEAQRTKDRMYVSLSGASCFRRLNGTHETGCSSKFGGSNGVLHVIRTAADFDFIHNDPPAPPYAVVVPTHLFTRALIMPLQRSPHVSGIVLTRQDSAQPPAEPFTHELQCPNAHSTYNNATCDAQWNPLGSGMLFESFPFPIYFMSDAAQIRTVVECYERFNEPDPATQHRRSLCSIQINQFMAAAGNAEICMRRNKHQMNTRLTRYCDPLSGHNVYATLFARPKISVNVTAAAAAAAAEDVASEDMEDLEDDDNTTDASPPTLPPPTTTPPSPAVDDEPFIMISARLDTTSMFDGIAPGAMELLPFITLMVTAHTLAALLPARTHPAQPNVLFAFFDGEAYDYIGSQRFVYDINKGRIPPRHRRFVPIWPENVQLHIDLAGLDDPAALIAYQIREFPRGAQLLSALEKYNRAFALGVNTTGRVQPDMPPSSVHSFLRVNTTWASVVLRSPTKNRFLHSVMDDTRNVRYKYPNTSWDFESLEDVTARPLYAADTVQMAVRNVSTLLAFSLFELVTGRPYSGRLGASAVLADELLYCYLNATSCPLMLAALSPKVRGAVGREMAPQRYISVKGNFVAENAGLTHELLGLLVGQRVAVNETECAEEPMVWMRGASGKGECRLCTQFLSEAASVAFKLKRGYDMTSNRYSTWTESTWSELNARLFLKPSAAHEALTLAIGFVVTTISFVLVFLINSRSDVLFGDGRRNVAATVIVEGVANAAMPANC